MFTRLRKLAAIKGPHMTTMLIQCSKFEGHFKSNQISFIGLRSSKDYYKRPSGGVSIWEESLGWEFLRRSTCAEGMGCGRR